MEVKPLTDAFGVELIDFDITRSHSPEEQAELRDLFCRHRLLLVRGDAIENADHDRFIGYFGPVSLSRDPEDAGYITNIGKRVFGPGDKELLWHADGTYGPTPGIGTSLWAKQVGEGAPGTGFLDAGLALRTLPDDLREAVAGMTAVHTRDTQVEQTDRPFRELEKVEDAPPGRYRSAEHPVVYTTPHAGYEVLLVNSLLTSHITGMSRAESDAMLARLFDHMKAAGQPHEHEWRNGDVIIWDNLALQHCRPKEVGSAPRHLRRLTLDGWYRDDGVLEWASTGGLRDPMVATA